LIKLCIPLVKNDNLLLIRIDYANNQERQEHAKVFTRIFCFAPLFGFFEGAKNKKALNH